MKISEIQEKDLVACAQVLSVLKTAKLEISAAEAVPVASAMQWLKEFSLQLADTFKKTAPTKNVTPEPPSDGFIVKDYNPGNMAATIAHEKKLNKKKK